MDIDGDFVDTGRKMNTGMFSSGSAVDVVPAFGSTAKARAGKYPNIEISGFKTSHPMRFYAPPPLFGVYGGIYTPTSPGNPFGASYSRAYVR